MDKARKDELEALFEDFGTEIDIDADDLLPDDPASEAHEVERSKRLVAFLQRGIDEGVAAEPVLAKILAVEAIERELAEWGHPGGKTVFVDPALKKQLELRARALGKKRYFMLNEAIRQYLETSP